MVYRWRRHLLLFIFHVIISEYLLNNIITNILKTPLLQPPKIPKRLPLMPDNTALKNSHSPQNPFEADTAATNPSEPGPAFPGADPVDKNPAGDTPFRAPFSTVQSRSLWEFCECAWRKFAFGTSSQKLGHTLRQTTKEVWVKRELVVGLGCWTVFENWSFGWRGLGYCS